MDNVYVETIRLSLGDPGLAAKQIGGLLRVARGDGRDCCPYAAQVFRYVAGGTAAAILDKARRSGWQVGEADNVEQRVAQLRLEFVEGSPMCNAIIGLSRSTRYDQLRLFWLAGGLVAQIDFAVWRPVYARAKKEEQRDNLLQWVPSATSVEIVLPGGERLRNGPQRLLSALDQRCGRPVPGGST